MTQEIEQILLTHEDLGDDCVGAAREILPRFNSVDTLAEFTRVALQQGAGSRPFAYFHSNGFLKIEYARTGHLGLRLRAHVWNPCWGLQQEQEPHDHSFSYVSKVIYGTIEQKIFSRGHGELGQFNVYAYHRDMRDGREHYFLEHAEQVSLCLSKTIPLATGDLYTSSGREIHTINPTGHGRAITVLVTKPHAVDHKANVYSKDGHLHEKPRNSAAVPVYDILRYVMDAGS